jgi:hypothetical protein
MKNTRVLLRVVASTLATAGLVLGLATASVAAPKATGANSRDTGWGMHSMSRDTGWG